MITIQSDLFEFAYVPDWYRHLHDLKCMALPEAWQFKKPAVETKNAETPILERYIHTIFRKQAIEFNSEQEYNKALKITEALFSGDIASLSENELKYRLLYACNICLAEIKSERNKVKCITSTQVSLRKPNTHMSDKFYLISLSAFRKKLFFFDYCLSIIK